MLVSYNWLKYYIDLPDSLTPEELALNLTLSTVEIEGVELQGKNFENIVVGEIKKIEKHADADKLSVCTVSDGKEDFQIVCGGSNLSEGMKVALGKIGAKVQWHGEGDLIELTKAKIRGVESYGMICASNEVGLGEVFPSKDEKEILDLSNLDIKVGVPLSKALNLNDAVLDIDNKSMTHRPDLWGHYGVAREVSVLYNKKLKEYKPSFIKKQETNSKKQIKLNVDVKDTELCPRYMAVAIDGVKVGPSPEWMQKILRSVGLRPINNIVDITNFILFDLGQPMHAFDAVRLQDTNSKKQETSIIVRHAKDGEKFTTLDEQDHELTSDMLVIADNEKAVALAGIMGGMNSEISDDTTSIVFESANFDATAIRKTATKLGIRTDSSTRFEKSLDPNNAELALRRAVELVLEICPEAKVASNVVDEKNYNLNQGPIELSLGFLNRKMGVDLEKKQVIKILESLGFHVKSLRSHVASGGEALAVTIPTWRATKDISIPEDLVEEVARIYGYGNIPVQSPKFPITPPIRNGLRDLERQIKDTLYMEYGYTETYNYSFVSPDTINKMGLDTKDHIELDNPIAKDRPYVRTTLLSNLLENVEKNMHFIDNLRLFEVGKIFDKYHSGARVEEKSDELLPRQDLMLAFVYSEKGNSIPFYEVSEVVSGLLDNLGVDYKLKSNNSINKYIHPGRQVEILAGDEVIGFMAELHPQVQVDLGIDERTSMVEINLDNLLKHVIDKTGYEPMALYPAVDRDIAFVVDSDVMHADVVAVIRDIDPLITHVELFDVFAGEKLGENKKSMAYHITYLSKEKTLEALDVDKIHVKVGERLKKEFGAEVRN